MTKTNKSLLVMASCCPFITSWLLSVFYYYYFFSFLSRSHWLNSRLQTSPVLIKGLSILTFMVNHQTFALIFSYICGHILLDQKQNLFITLRWCNLILICQNIWLTVFPKKNNLKNNVNIHLSTGKSIYIPG